jgi:hypothetical protein
MTNLSRRAYLGLYLLIGLILLLACRFGFAAPTPTPEDCRVSTDPTEQDVQYALAFTGSTFETNDWKRSYTVETFRVSITWLNDAEGALAYLERLIYSCGYNQTDMENYYSEENFTKVIFRDYQEVTRQARCSNKEDELTLYEFTAQSQGQDYLIRYWVKLDSTTRVLTMLLAFPIKSKELLDKYAKEVFPTLSACSE